MLTNVASGWDGLPDNALNDKACWIKITNLKQQNYLMGLIYKGGLRPPKFIDNLLGFVMGRAHPTWLFLVPMLRVGTQRVLRLNMHSHAGAWERVVYFSA
jgi:hypothetical protein